MLPVLWFSLLTASASASDVAGDQPSIVNPTAPASSEKLIFILAGQSNMAGRGGVSGNHWDHKLPSDCLPNPWIQRLSASLVWEQAQEPLHFDIDLHKTCGVGPALPFAHTIMYSVRQTGLAVIGLVPCAVGGTRITEWARGTVLYQNMVERARSALNSGGGRIGALLWYQGESDTVKKEDAELYGTRLEMLINDVRVDLGLPQLLFIQVALASGEGPYIEIVRQAQKSIKIQNVRTVDAMGLQLERDHLHLTTQAQVQLGKMLAQSYLNSGTSAY